MKRVSIGLTVLTLMTWFIASGWSAATGTAAQESDEDLAATVEVLQTQVADLEDRVATLEAAGGAGADADDGAAGASQTPAGSGGGVRSGGSGTRDNPLPVGEIGTVRDYAVRVIEVIPNATDLVMAENQFNEPPAEGNQFFMATVEVAYSGNETGNPAFDLNFQAVGTSNVAYTTFDNTCGVVPNDQFTANELFPGGAIQFNVCWAVATEDVDSLVMFVEPAFSFDETPNFFAVREGA
jgi:hypothetical protein